MTSKRYYFSVIVFLLLSLAMRAETTIYDLHCEQKIEPVGMDNPRPVFGWKIFADRRNVMQRAYRIVVVDAAGAEVWNSGWQKTEQAAGVEYEGRPLESDAEYRWTVEVKAEDGSRAKSKAERFYTGLFDEKDWGAARWIALEKDGETLFPYAHLHYKGEVGRYCLPEFRKAFSVGKEIERATAYVCGLGQFEFLANGAKVGNHFLDPGWTLYNKEAMYVTFDVTPLLRKGENTLGVLLGNGFYNIPNERYYKLTGSFGAPKMKMRLVLHYKDGTTDDIVSDESWLVRESEITFSSIYGGEDVQAGVDDWQSALLCNPQPAIQLKNQFTHPLTIRLTLPPMTVTCIDSTRTMFDFGQNFSGIVRLKVKGKEGAKVVIWPAELLKDISAVNASLSHNSARDPFGIDQGASGAPYFFTYTLRGDEAGETWQPHFTYYGFRYALVETTDGVESLSLEGLHTCYAAPEAGRFECSLPLLNKTYELIDWAMRSNMASVLTDCPHREKQGWLEQTYLMQPSLLYRYDLQLLYRKLADDMAVSQTSEGVIPTIAPEYVRFADGFEDTPEWGSAFIIALWNIYKWYGDASLMRRYYPQMKRYVEYLDTRATDGIVAYGLGDWYDIGPKPPGYAQLTTNGVTATAIYHYNCLILSQIAALQGMKDEANLYANKAEEIKHAFHRKYYNAATQTYDRNSQTTNAVVLCFDLCPDSLRSRVKDNLLTSLYAPSLGRTGEGPSLTAGDIGYSFLLKALAQNGLEETIFRMNNRYDVPGYGWQLAHGATALTESWQAYGSVSNNHFMLGHLMEWLFSGLAGLSQTEESVGFKTLRIDPQMVGSITHASATRITPYGEARSSWRRDADRIEIDVTVPANSRAEVWLPTSDITTVREHGRQLSAKEMIKKEYGKICVLVGSGEYKFVIKKTHLLLCSE